MASTFFASILPIVIAVLAVAGEVQAQNDEGRFKWVQPADTVILGPYGHSPPVYPSRRSPGLQAYTDLSAGTGIR